MGRYRPDGQDLLVDMVGDREVKPMELSMFHNVEEGLDETNNVICLAIVYGRELRGILNHRQLLYRRQLQKRRNVGDNGERAEVRR